jgi:hypothetical protein
MRRICAKHYGHAPHMRFVAHVFLPRRVRNRRGEFEPRSNDRKASTFRLDSWERTSVPSSPRPAGFPTLTGHHGPESDPVDVRPLSTQWLSNERIAEARRVWSKAYGRVISNDEAIEVLMNVRRLAEVLLRAEEEQDS